ncbi:LysR family transcriptional regulator [Pseudoroseomonas wenyumeiae]|uniref:LysR family transcriptional regulator n=1 Tax=Teichococcus wenyumeiae TaxID=2478470 RepID=A0A3A9JPZ3_9PROT|nr:LysR substrate-binding domain-containing protein [Pseudoroseomonas wenyumeiae]RKK05874.1 LysR family transcriptional regulator [Pseudoroseomonas wenyumeiae]RMI25897.1 LysR family transcriptional regulator [Pseudoroseomonas wenyumeiae]
MKRPPLPFESLWAFRVIAETGSLTAAAAALGVTQPAVSKRLRDLELIMGCSLVRRGVNAIGLTRAGVRFAEELQEGFAQIQAAVDHLQTQSAPLRIRAYTTWALRWLIPRLPRFHAAHPGIDVEVSTSTAIVDLAREGVDAAVHTVPAGAAPPFGGRRLQAVMISPFAAPSILKGMPGRWPSSARLLGSKVRARDWDLWLRQAGPASTQPPLLFESTTLAIQAAMEGLGIVICSPSFVRDEVQTGKLVALSDISIPTGDLYWLFLPTGRVGEALGIFADWLVREAQAESTVPDQKP